MMSFGNAIVSVALTLVLTFVPVIASPQWNEPAFYPSRSTMPIGAKTFESRGIFVQLGHGTKSGAVTIKNAAGKEFHFFIGRGPMDIDGRSIDCYLSPTPMNLKGFYCNDWPRTIVSGQTIVYVSYFWAQRNGRRVPVALAIRRSATDEKDVVPIPAEAF